MRRNVKNFIKTLPGPQSYCKCDTLCSPLEIEHVMPKAILKKHRNFNKSKSDPHNLYTCCSKMNRQKDCLQFGKDYVLDNETSYHTGPLARACLHMTDTYNLDIDPNTIAVWEILNQNHEPHVFEYQRNELIIERTGDNQLYLPDDNDINDIIRRLQ